MRGTWAEAGLTVLKVCGRGADCRMAFAGMPWKSAVARGGLRKCVWFYERENLKGLADLYSQLTSKSKPHKNILL